MELLKEDGRIRKSKKLVKRYKKIKCPCGNKLDIENYILSGDFETIRTGLILIYCEECGDKTETKI